MPVPSLSDVMKGGTSAFSLAGLEGTWTPVLAFGGSSTGIAGTFTGTYIKSGKLVLVTASLILTSKGSATGNTTITGLPFSVGTTAAISIGSYSSMASVSSLLGFVAAGTTAVSLRLSAATAVAIPTDANFTNTTNLVFSAVYPASV